MATRKLTESIRTDIRRLKTSQFDHTLSINTVLYSATQKYLSRSHPLDNYLTMRPLARKTYSVFSKERHHKYKHQYPGWQDLTIVNKIKNEWENLTSLRKQELEDLYLKQGKIKIEEENSSDEEYYSRTPGQQPYSQTQPRNEVSNQVVSRNQEQNEEVVELEKELQEQGEKPVDQNGELQEFEDHSVELRVPQIQQLQKQFERQNAESSKGSVRDPLQPMEQDSDEDLKPSPQVKHEHFELKRQSHRILGRNRLKPTRKSKSSRKSPILPPFPQKSRGAGLKSVKREAEVAPKKTNAYLRFYHERYRTIHRSHPDLTPIQITKIIKEQWRRSKEALKQRARQQRQRNFKPKSSKSLFMRHKMKEGLLKNEAQELWKRLPHQSKNLWLPQSKKSQNAPNCEEYLLKLRPDSCVLPYPAQSFMELSFEDEEPEINQQTGTGQPPSSFLFRKIT